MLNNMDLIYLIILFIKININELIEAYGYLGFAVVSFLATLTVVFPIPYLIVIFNAAATQRFNPAILSIVSGFGATLGELWLYFVGRGGRKILPEQLRERSLQLRKMVEKYGALIVFIFAATPLPDDLIYPLLGVLKIDLKEIFIAAFLGKTLLSAFVAYAGFYSYQFVRELIGGPVDTTTNIIISLIILVFSILIMFLFLSIDWSKYVNLE